MTWSDHNASPSTAGNEHVLTFGDVRLTIRDQALEAGRVDETVGIEQQHVLRLGHGEAHVIRNAGGVVTDDVVRSLVLSQRLLGTREIILIHHTDCGLQKVSEDDFKSELEEEFGITFSDERSPIRTVADVAALIQRELSARVVPA